MAVINVKGKNTVKSQTKYNRHYRKLVVAVKEHDIKTMQWALVEMLVDDIKLQELGKNNTFKDLIRMVGRLSDSKEPDEKDQRSLEEQELAEWAGVDGDEVPETEAEVEPEDEEVEE
jgi:hypothetical protein